MGRNKFRLRGALWTAALLGGWLILASGTGRAQSPADPPPSLPPSEDAAARMAKIEKQLQALEKRNKKLQEQHDELTQKYQSLLQTNSPVFGATANNPDGMGVPGAIQAGISGGQPSGGQKSSTDDKEGTRPRASEGKDTGAKTEGKKEEKKDGKTDQKKDQKGEEDWYEVGSDGVLKPVWRDRRFFLESAHRDFQLRFTGRFNWDTGWFTQSGGMPNFEDASDFRRARIGLEGYLYENFYFRARYDFANSSSTGSSTPGGNPASNFRDVFMRVEKLPFVGNFQAGQWKEPISLTWQSTSNQLIFLERPAMFNALNPQRNVGFSLFRNFADDRIFLISGLFRSATNGGGFSSGDGQWASTTRMAFLPYWQNEGRCLVHFGGSYSYRAFNHIDTNGNQPRFATVPDVSIGTPNVLDTGVIKGPFSEDLLSGEFVTVLGPLSIQSEILGLRINGDKGVHPLYWGTYAQVSYFLTGENRRYRRTGPYAFSFTTPNVSENFFTLSRWPYILGRGAWEIAARYDYLDLSGGGLFVPTASDGSGGTGRWNGMTYAINWWLNSNSTIMFDYIHGWRDSDTPHRYGQIDTFAMRFRFFF